VGESILNYRNIYIFVWMILLLNAGMMSVYVNEYYLPQTGLMNSPYGYLPIIYDTIINVIGILALGIIYILKWRNNKNGRTKITKR